MDAEVTLVLGGPVATFRAGRGAAKSGHCRGLLLSLGLLLIRS